MATAREGSKPPFQRLTPEGREGARDFGLAKAWGGDGALEESEALG